MFTAALLACCLYNQDPIPPPAPEARLARSLARVRAMPAQSQLRVLPLLEELLANAAPELKPELEKVIREIKSKTPPATAGESREAAFSLTGLPEAQQEKFHKFIKRFRALPPERQKRVLAILDAEAAKSHASLQAFFDGIRTELQKPNEPGEAPPK